MPNGIKLTKDAMKYISVSKCLVQDIQYELLVDASRLAAFLRPCSNHVEQLTSMSISCTKPK